MRILFLDDDSSRRDLFYEMAKRRYPEAAIYMVKKAEEAITALQGRTFDHIYLDHDLADFHYMMPAASIREGTGMDVVRHIVDQHREKGRFGKTLFVVHSWNPDGGRLMHEALQEEGLKVVRKEFGLEVVQ